MLGMAELTKDEALERNVAFMQRCKSKELDKKESIRGGRWIQQLSEDKRNELLGKIFAYDAWTPETDPTNTKAAGVIHHNGHVVLWTIREMDITPSGVLTIGPNLELVLMVKHSSEI